jgi:predicted lipid-binding transport protein (Tim44 family)
MRVRTLVVLVSLIGSSAACGPTAAPITPTSPPTAVAKPAGVASNQEAVRELQATTQGYVQAQQAFLTGDRNRALELMNAAYLEHFERTEAWIDQAVSKEYRESVESAISRDLRRKLRDGAPNEDIAAQFPVAMQRLQEAQTRLAALP